MMRTLYQPNGRRLAGIENRGLRLLILLVVGCMLPLYATPADDAQQAIRAAYDRCQEAAELRFVEGMLSDRTPDFQAQDPRGKPLNLRFERRRLRSMLNRALTVHDSTHIDNFSCSDGKHAMCHIRDDFELLMPAPDNSFLHYTIHSVCEDNWLLTSEGWRLRKTRIVQQTVEKKPATLPPLK
ncbi:MAG: hypothetical protein ACYCW6_07195 [Candidatus Xenobia bacterium]